MLIGDTAVRSILGLRTLQIAYRLANRSRWRGPMFPE